MRAFCLILLAAAAPVAAEEITTADLLSRVVDLDRLAQPPVRGERQGWLSGVGMEGAAGADGWRTLGRIDAPGALTRVYWRQPAGEIRLVLDGEAVLTAPLAELFGGSVAPFGAPLTYRLPEDGAGISYYPIGFSRSCEVQGREIVGPWQVEYTTFAPGTRVERFDAMLEDDAAEALERAVRWLSDGISEEALSREFRLGTIAIQNDLRPRETLSETMEGAGTIRDLAISVTDRVEPREPGAMHKCILRIYFDGSEEPAVEAPLSAFFGSGFERASYNSLPLGTDRWSDLPGEWPLESWQMYCLWPMPFREGARVEIENRTRRRVGFMLYLRVERNQPGPRAPRLNVRYRPARAVGGGDFEAAGIDGRGRLVGIAWLANTVDPVAMGATSMRLGVDGVEAVPAGSDLASFLGLAQSYGASRQALHGVSQPHTYGRTAAFRWLVPDSVRFERSLRLTAAPPRPAEGLASGGAPYFGCAVFWYADAPGGYGFSPLRPEDLELPPPLIPGAVEIEGAIDGEGWGNIMQQRHAGMVEFSGGAAANITRTDGPVTIRLTSPRTGRFQLGVRVHPTRSFGSIEVRDASGRLVGAVEYSRTPDGIHTVGPIDLVEGENTVTVVLSRSTVMDCWILTPMPMETDDEP